MNYIIKSLQNSYTKMITLSHHKPYPNFGITCEIIIMLQTVNKKLIMKTCAYQAEGERCRDIDE